MNRFNAGIYNTPMAEIGCFSYVPAVDQMFVSTPNSYIEALIPSVIVLGSWGGN